MIKSNFNVLGKINEKMQELNGDSSIFYSKYDYVQNEFNKFKSYINESTEDLRGFYEKEIYKMSLSYNIHKRIFLLTFLLNTFVKTKYLNDILRVAKDSDELDKNNRYFLMYQCIRIGFTSSGLGDSETGLLNRELYRKIYEEFKLEIKEELGIIPKEQRNKNLIFVMTSQLLGLSHAPTKTALDRCYCLMQQFGKEIILINTKDLMTSKGYIPVYNASFGSVISEFESIDKIPYKDKNIPFYQTSYLMPDLEEVINILNLVKRHKPYMIITIGGANITADICSNVVPEATISTVYSSLPLTEGQLHIVGKKTDENDLNFIRKFGFDKANILESIFTFDFKKQDHVYNREEFNLPKDKFLIAVVGARLDYEVTEEFINTFMDTIESGTHMVFVGDFEKYKELVLKNKELKNYSSCLGFQGDVLGILELCNLYLNPLRAGGGSSAVEAMYMGVPVISLNTGDVSVAVGEDFCVKSYDEMKEKIKEYALNKRFHNYMSCKSKKRAEVLMDTTSELKIILSKIESSNLFN